MPHRTIKTSPLLTPLELFFSVSAVPLVLGLWGLLSSPSLGTYRTFEVWSTFGCLTMLICIAAAGRTIWALQKCSPGDEARLSTILKLLLSAGLLTLPYTTATAFEFLRILAEPTSAEILAARETSQKTAAKLCLLAAVLSQTLPIISTGIAYRAWLETRTIKGAARRLLTLSSSALVFWLLLLPFGRLAPDFPLVPLVLAGAVAVEMALASLVRLSQSTELALSYMSVGTLLPFVGVVAGVVLCGFVLPDRWVVIVCPVTLLGLGVALQGWLSLWPSFKTSSLVEIPFYMGFGAVGGVVIVACWGWIFAALMVPDWTLRIGLAILSFPFRADPLGSLAALAGLLAALLSLLRRPVEIALWGVCFFVLEAFVIFIVSQ